jgi:hypothetical protein
MKPKVEGDFTTRRPSRWMFEVRIVVLALVLAALVCIPLLPILAIGRLLDAIFDFGGFFAALGALALLALVAIVDLIYAVLTGDWAQLIVVLQAILEWLRSAGYFA